jgi:hypothetical protein
VVDLRMKKDDKKRKAAERRKGTKARTPKKWEDARDIDRRQ